MSFLSTMQQRLSYLWDRTSLQHRIQTPYSFMTNFLWLGLCVLVLGLIAITVGIFYLQSEKSTITNAIKLYGDGILAQLPSQMTGVIQKENDDIVAHLNNDQPLMIQLNIVDGETLPTEIDTSREDMDNLTGIISMRKFGLGIKKDSGEIRWFDYGDMTQQYGLFSGSADESITLDIAKIKAGPELLSNVLSNHWGSLLASIAGIGLLWILFFGGFLLFCYIVWHVILQGIVRIVVSLISKLWKGVSSDMIWTIITRVSFVPFLIYSFIGMPYYGYIMIIIAYVSWRSWQLRK